MEHIEVLIVGAGAAGIAAAKAATAAGCRVLLVDSHEEMGGVLRQCAHRGFGRGLTGPDYVRQLLDDFPTMVQFCGGTTVLALNEKRQALLASAAEGRRWLAFEQVILATGCYEVPIGALSIAGTRPMGIYTAGQMQERMNIYHLRPQGPVVILGSGDLGLVMAEQLAANGCVVTLVEQAAQCGGLARNRRCLGRPEVTLYCGATIVEVLGTPHIEAVRLSDGTMLSCQTLLIAVGLRPDRQLLEDGSERLAHSHWLHLCGNCRQVQAMVEAVVQDGMKIGKQVCGK